MNSSTARSESEPKSSSLRMRPRWKSPSPWTIPSRLQNATPSADAGEPDEAPPVRHAAASRARNENGQGNRAGDEHEHEREVERSVHGERHRKRARDERDRPDERCGRAAATERAGDEPARQQQHERRRREAQPEPEAVLGQEPRDAEQRQAQSGEQRSSEQLADASGGEPAAPSRYMPAPLAADEHAAQAQRDEEQPARALRVRVAAVLAEEAELAAQVLDEQPALVRGRVHVRRAGAGEEERPSSPAAGSDRPSRSPR